MRTCDINAAPTCWSFFCLAASILLLASCSCSTSASSSELSFFPAIWGWSNVLTHYQWQLMKITRVGGWITLLTHYPWQQMKITRVGGWITLLGLQCSNRLCLIGHQTGEISRTWAIFCLACDALSVSYSCLACHLASVFGTKCDFTVTDWMAGGLAAALVGRPAEDDGGQAAVVGADNPGDGVPAVPLDADAGHTWSWTFLEI